MQGYLLLNSKINLAKRIMAVFVRTISTGGLLTCFVEISVMKLECGEAIRGTLSSSLSESCPISPVLISCDVFFFLSSLDYHNKRLFNVYCASCTLIGSLVISFRTWLQNNVVPITMVTDCKENARSMSECDAIVLPLEGDCPERNIVWLSCTHNFTGNVKVLFVL